MNNETATGNTENSGELAPFDPELQPDEVWKTIDTYLYLYTRGGDVAQGQRGINIDVITTHQNPETHQICTIDIALHPDFSYFYKVIFSDKTFILTKDNKLEYLARDGDNIPADPNDLLAKLEQVFGGLNGDKLIENYYQSLDRAHTSREQYAGWRAEQRTAQDQDQLHQATEPAGNANFADRQVETIMTRWGIDEGLRELVKAVVGARLENVPEAAIYRQWLLKLHPDINRGQEDTEELTKQLTGLFDSQKRQFIF